MITKQASLQLKAIAIFLVILEHILGTFFHADAYLCSLLGTGGVSIFLFLSGYGLYTSYQEKGITAKYWIHKVKKVFVPYWVITLFWLGVTNQQFGFKTILKTMFFVDFDRKVDGTMWYMSFQIMWYIIFFLIFIIPKITNAAKISILFLFSFGFLFCDHIKVFGDCTWQFMISAFVFPLGCLFAALAEKKIKVTKPVCLVIIVCAVAYLIFYYSTKNGSKYLANLTGLCAMLVVFAIVYPIGRTKIILTGLVKILTGLGSISYIAYLWEGKLFTPVAKTGIQNAWLQTVVYILLLLIAVGAYYGIGKMISKIFKKNVCFTGGL